MTYYIMWELLNFEMRLSRTKLLLLLAFCLLVDFGNSALIPKQSAVSPRDDSEKTVFTLEEYFDGYFSASGFNGTWLSDNYFLYKSSEGDYYKFDVVTKTATLFINGSFLDDYSGASISLSPDETVVLIRYNVSSVYRHSTTAIYAVYNIANRAYYHINDKTAVQLATFSTTGHALAYVYLNNIYYLKDISNDENPVKVTEDGEDDVIYNGVPDWVYEEEVFGTGSALWFSPDGKKLAYAQFNDTNVAGFSYFIYGTAGSMDDQYPTTRTIKYPKVGEQNPLVTTFIYDTESQNTTKVNLISSIENSEDNNDYVLYDITWISDSELAMISSNRIQNESVIIRCYLNGNCSQESSYSQANGWLSPKIPNYNADGTLRLEILPQSYEDDYFNHLVLTNVSSHTSTRLTYGNRVVTTVYRWDQTNNLVYYGSSVNDTPSQQQISVVNTITTEDKCLTCNFTVDDADDEHDGLCKYAGASFNSLLTYFIKICQGPNPYFATIQSLSNDSDTYLWNNNSKVRERLSKKLRFSQKDLLVPVANNFTARVRLLLPPNFNDSERYPAVVYVYGGPNSNVINDAFSSGVVNYLVTNRSYIYIYIDGRGSGRDGQSKTFQIYRSMGTVEIEDQIAVTKYLQENFPYIDRNRTGIWGWSYGGFASSWVLAKDTENIFKFALAVAPVTSFIYYDTIYTERYMGLPTDDDNLLGYNNTDLTRVAESFRGKLYYIIHGNADDNVHYQNALLLIKSLVAADIQFWQQSYPDESHSLSGVAKHLYHTIDKFFARAFGIEGPPLVV
ncbi:venom dipeptidyl peptidase 4 isoform X2 [Dendroctonus ponderosae]|uniref:venom dipeptidyl peptidase 4 isoform X2 n=1 Tax=Dendroctonus ponderosae TaxID=77166 RepID=UPI0020364B18|nr:venom dipeptidyl peptidase 4 isoform X2 [Dendroctonus ponderosae]KAH1024091.1 hypothetical protein HUJ05_003648 [Dendroctonus ponderosae]KAH1024092.1 hypothetical protein HUJ05_003648 [Dendroctonus ponderosae]